MAQDRLGIGVIGAGGIARRKTIPALLETANCRLAAVMDPVGVDEISVQFGHAPAYCREHDLLADPGVEAVYIASPVDCHARQIIAAAEAGKHILCEKPLARTAEEARTAVEACRRHGVFLQVGYMMKFHGAHVKIKQLIDQGRLGRIVSMRAQLSCWYPPIAGAWRQEPARGGGGALVDMATHLFDLLEHFVGPATRVVAFTGNLVHDYPAEDASTTLLEFASGAQATVDSFFCIPDEASRTRLEVYGSRGSVLSQGTVGQSTGGVLEGILDLGGADYDAQQDKDVARTLQPIPFDAINPYKAECEHFAACVLAGHAPEINGVENAVRMVVLAETAYQSARLGKALPVTME